MPALRPVHRTTARSPFWAGCRSSIVDGTASAVVPHVPGPAKTKGGSPGAELIPCQPESMPQLPMARGANAVPEMDPYCHTPFGFEVDEKPPTASQHVPDVSVADASAAPDPDPPSTPVVPESPARLPASVSELPPKQPAVAAAAARTTRPRPTDPRTHAARRRPIRTLPEDRHARASRAATAIRAGAICRSRIAWARCRRIAMRGLRHP